MSENGAARVRWAELTAAEIGERAARDGLVIVPVGSIEQHGPHLPTGTDTMLGQTVAEAAAAQIASHEPVVVTPPVWQGLSEHHMSFGGTITMSTATFEAVLRDVVGSIARCGFSRVFLLNSHGGNDVFLKTVTDNIRNARLNVERPIKVACGTYWLLGQPELAPILERQKGIRHACEAETSMMMVVHPELVKEDRLHDADTPDERDGDTPPPRAHRLYRFEEKTATGAIGIPSAATREKGEKLLDLAARECAKIIRDERLWR